MLRGGSARAAFALLGPAGILAVSLGSEVKKACGPLPSLGEGDYTLTARIRTTRGGVVFSLSSENGVWAGGGKSFTVRGGRLGCDFANVGIWTGRTVVADGQWHHAAWTYSASARRLQFYVDGVEDGAAEVAGLPDVAGDVLRIGMAAPGITPPNGFTGEIDDVALYPRVLSTAEMRAANLHGAAAFWPLDGYGRDASGNGHDGVVVDAERADGPGGVCLRFAGNSSVAVVDPNAELLRRVRAVNPAGLKAAVQDLAARHGHRYADGPARLRRATVFVSQYTAMVAGVEAGDASSVARARELLAFQREALLSDPGLDFDRIVAVRRAGPMGLPMNWESNSSLPTTGYDNEIVEIAGLRGDTSMRTLYKPSGGRFIGDLDLRWDTTRLLASMPGSNGRWQVHEFMLDGSVTEPRELVLISEPDVDNYDACYLPDGGVMFTSTAPFVGVPCVTGSAHVSNLYRTEPGGSIRRLTFEQDHDWCPTVMDDGRILYLRWEYSDLPHFVSRILFTMNPDGTNQSALYGTNSYWPNSMFYARPMPGSGTRFAAIVSGHHDVPRMGELVLFDAAKGAREAEGVLQRIPGRGKPVVPVILDGLVKDKWPKFLHPWPLEGERFLVSAQLAPGGRWGLYLADRFDNLVLICDTPAGALLEPIPLRARTRPPTIPSKVSAGAPGAVVSLTDVYQGDALAGVPRGTVKSLRLLSYHFAYHGVGGQVHRVGLDGPWDVKRILGTVPVRPDGSALFRVPANTPISIQPLDADGRALQLMRSWMTAMPGERVTCVGCHERQASSSPNRRIHSPRGKPDAITPWYGPSRGFSFRREVQPVLNAHCVRCHAAGGSPDLRDLPDVRPQGRDPAYNNASHFPPSYLALRAFVRGHTIESDMHMLTPGEFHASTTRLVRMLEKGHHGVRLDREAWDRLNTWIDLNTPAHGTWADILGPEYVSNQRQRRMAMDARYARLAVDGEAIPATPSYRPKPSRAARATSPPTPLLGEERGAWPESRLPARSASGAQTLPLPARSASGAQTLPLPARGERVRVRGASRHPALSVDLGGARLELVWIPPGHFTMGDAQGCRDESPTTPITVARGFYMGRFEITNAQYARFDPLHDSRVETGDFLQFSVEERGYPANEPNQPVCRVSWDRALAFCRRLSARTGKRFSLPTEAQWEYACRAGSRTAMNWGDASRDFGLLANLADATLRKVDTFAPWALPSGAIQPWRPAIEGVNDAYRVSAPAGSYRPNAFGLYDMHGNIAEWTRSLYAPYPYRDGDGRNRTDRSGTRVVRGGSWWDRPAEARSAYRAAYPQWRRVFDVGFRVVCEE